MTEPSITLNPVCGWAAATIPEGNVLLELNYVSSPEQPLEKAHEIRFALTGAQCLELAEVLQRKAELSRMRHNNEIQ